MPTFKVLRYMQTHTWDEAAKLRLKSETHLDLEAVLQRYVVYLLERRLKSADFIYRLRRETQALEER
jgi:hypothetical protein